MPASRATPVRRAGGRDGAPAADARSQRVPDIRVGAQRGVGFLVLLARRAVEHHAHRYVIALAGWPFAHAGVQHRQPESAQDFRYALAQVRVGVAHRGDLEAARELEALAVLLLDVVEVTHAATLLR